MLAEMRVLLAGELGAARIGVDGGRERGLEAQGHELAACDAGRVPGPLGVRRVRRGQAVPVCAGPLTRLYDAGSAGNHGIKVDQPAGDGIAGGRIQDCVLNSPVSRQAGTTDSGVALCPVARWW